MNKMQMAHEYFLGIISNPSATLRAEDLRNTQHNAWVYADAMQAEADERECKERPEALCEVDWRVAPEWAKYWAIREGGDTALWCINKPTVTADCFLSHGGCGVAPSFGFTGSHIVERPQ